MSEIFDPKKTCGKPCSCPSYRDHLRSISVSAQATPSRDRSRETVEAHAREKKWNKDMPAYRRLRDEGLQPPHIDGADKLEATATDKIEITAGKSLGNHLDTVKEIQTLQRELMWRNSLGEIWTHVGTDCPAVRLGSGRAD